MIKLFTSFTLFFAPALGLCQSTQGILPIQVGRTISFTTTEGSNMSVDISPNGKTIVFDLLGDLYIVPVKGGIAKQITRGIAVHTRPVWSPKGDRIAFVSDASGVDRLTIMDTSGSFFQALGERCRDIPIWNATGDWITTSQRNAEGEYFMYYLGGGKTNMPKDIDKIIGFSPDNRFIYYEDKTNAGIRCISQYDNAARNRNVLVEFEKRRAGQFFNAKVSKDNRWASYLVLEHTSCTLAVFDLIERKERILAQWQCQVPVSSRTFPIYGFSADSKRIIIGYGGKIHLLDVLSGNDQIVPFKVHLKVDLGVLNYNTFKVSQDALQVKYIRSAHASPDGKHLVFSALGRIYVMNIPNGIPRVLAEQPLNQFQPTWSPDSKWIAYVSWSDTAFGQVWKAGLDGQSPVQISQEPGVYHYPTWSSDGNSIVVLKGEEWWDGKLLLGDRDGPGYGKLLLIGINDGTVRIVADTVPLSNRPSFSKDGARIIYTPLQVEGPGGTCPYLVAKGLNTEPEILAISQGLFGIGDQFFMRQVIISPDEKFIVYLNQENLFLVPLLKTDQPSILYSDQQKLPIIRFARGGFDPHWESEGKILSWSFANKYYQVDPNKIVTAAINAAQERSRTGLIEPDILDVNIIPDATIVIDIKAPRNVSKGMVAIKNARIITMNNKGVIEKGTLLINNGKFIAVGTNNQVMIPQGSKVMDMEGKTIMPGLIDLHDHVRLPAEVFPQQKWDLLADLAYGITTAREPSGSHDSFGYEELIAIGRMMGPRLFNVGRAVRDKPFYPAISNLNEARIIVQNRASMGAVVVKQYTQKSRVKRELLLLACHEAGLNMTNEVEQDMRGFLGHLKDGSSGIEHNPLWGEVYMDVINLVAASGTFLTPTLQAPYGTQSAKFQFWDIYCKPGNKLSRFYPDKEIKRRCDGLQEWRNDSNVQKMSSFLKQSLISAAIRKQGGKVTMGSHGEDPGLGAHFEIWALKMGGLTNLEALEAATIMAAGALGMQNDLGSIEVGKIADLLILNKNPLDNIQYTIEIRNVMKDGILYDGNSLEVIKP